MAERREIPLREGFDEFGRELPDPTPMEVPVSYCQGPTLKETIQRMMHHEMLRQRADAEGFDSFEEGDDFEIEDDPLDPHTPYEAYFDPPVEKPLTRRDGSDIGVSSNVGRTQENDYGSRSSGAVEGRVDDRVGGDRGSDKVGKGESGSQQDADDGRGVREADRGASSSRK